MTDRWNDPSTFPPQWRVRTARIAQMILLGETVLEFGCGDCHLSTLLPDGCRYMPSDLVSRTPDTIVCDLNAAFLPVFPVCDVAVFGGVLEYVNDVPRLLRTLRRSAGSVIASYAISGIGDNEAMRLSNGWVNNYTSHQLFATFQSAGYVVATNLDMWQSQIILRME